MSDSCDPMDWRLLGSLVQGILQARIQEWVAISFSRWSFHPRSWVFCIAGRFFSNWAIRESLTVLYPELNAKTDFWTMWEKMRVGWFERIALKHVYYHVKNRWSVQVRCMKQDIQSQCSGTTQSDRKEGVQDGGIHAYPWLIYIFVWQNHHNIVSNYPSIKINKLI